MLGNQEDAVLDIEMEETKTSRIISGTILDCNNNPLSNAYVLLFFQDKKYQDFSYAIRNILKSTDFIFDDV